MRHYNLLYAVQNEPTVTAVGFETYDFCQIIDDKFPHDVFDLFSDYIDTPISFQKYISFSEQS